MSRLSLTTNAPSRWEPVVITGFRDDNSSDADLVNHMLFVEAAEDALEKSGSRVEFLDYPRLLGSGIVRVPVFAKGLDGAFDIFFYPRADEKAASHYAALLEAAKENKNFKPIFYAPSNLLEVRPGAQAKALHQDRLFIQRQNVPLEGQYAMWWGNGSEPFESSHAFKILDEIFSRANGQEDVLAGKIMEALGGKPGSLELPEDMLSINVKGPENIPLVISFSQKRGVRFHFHTKKTSPEIRDRFLEHVLRWVSIWLPSPTRHSSDALEWWRNIQKKTMSMTVFDVQQGVSAVGSIHR